jgi:predicted DNA-binding transcriptional regulator YafY
MNKFDKNCIKGRIILLAKLRSTGTPAQLAMKFEISERSVKRIINELRRQGNDIRYDYNCISYVWTEK